MATMGPWSRVRAAKCQMLVTSFLVLLLGLSMATLAALTYFGAHFAVLGHASSDRTPYEAVHRWAFYACISLAGLLTLGAVLGAAATVREAGGLMAGGFLCFALVFGALAQAAFWRLHSPTQVEDAMLDAYDLLYDRAVRSLSSTPRQQLLAIQDTFLCCGKSSPFSLLGDAEASLCRGEQAARQGVRETQRARGSQPHAAAQAAQQTPKKGTRWTPGQRPSIPMETYSFLWFPPDCLVRIESSLRTYGHIVSILTGIGLAAMVYAMLLSAFLWFSIRSGSSLDRRGKYTLNQSSGHPVPKTLVTSEVVRVSRVCPCDDGWLRDRGWSPERPGVQRAPGGEGPEIESLAQVTASGALS
ncbi:tetraspanin-32 isoform X2 [Ailuropoda melanoleuca]|uniref:tetraspanin-32 isoform X2 n=1 Tax=Ailuropoda melanoleuca TaxID=9646 RepID=UPI0014944988|nr:tetraspanin-32 isoform X2 [Ailuropoda melanoleuca]